MIPTALYKFRWIIAVYACISIIAILLKFGAHTDAGGRPDDLTLAERQELEYKVLHDKDAKSAARIVNYYMFHDVNGGAGDRYLEWLQIYDQLNSNRPPRYPAYIKMLQDSAVQNERAEKMLEEQNKRNENNK